MAGVFSFRRAEAEALPLTADTVRTVIARARRACLAQLAGFSAVAAGFGWVALRADGAAAGVSGGVAALSLWGVLGSALSTWDHVRTRRVLLSLPPGALADETDTRKFWFRYRGLFPMSWED